MIVICGKNPKSYIYYKYIYSKNPHHLGHRLLPYILAPLYRRARIGKDN
jgi:hypothetical protein